jgi:transposase
MPKPLIEDALWARIEPLLPKKRRRTRYAGRLPLEDRAVLTGILFVLRSGIPWEMLPKEMGCGSGMTCWRRLRDWQRQGVWDRLHCVLLSELRGADQLDFSRAVADSSSIRAVGAGKKVDRTQPIAVVRAASTTFSRMPKASRSR